MHRPLHTSHHPQIERTLLSVECERGEDSTHRDQDKEAGDARTVETVPVPAPRVRFFVVPVARRGKGTGQAHPDREGSCDVSSVRLGYARRIMRFPHGSRSGRGEGLQGRRGLPKTWKVPFAIR